MRTDNLTKTKVIELYPVGKAKVVNKIQDPILVQFFRRMKRTSKAFQAVTKVTESIAICTFFLGMCAEFISGVLILWALGIAVLVAPYVIVFLGAVLIAVYHVVDDERMDRLQRKLDARKAYHQRKRSRRVV